MRSTLRGVLCSGCFILLNMIFQILASLVFCSALVLTWRRAKQGALRLIEGISWTIVWLGAGVIVWRPEVTTRIALLFGIGRGSDFILYIAVILLAVGFFSLALAFDRVERSITKFVELQALEAFRRDSFKK